MILNAPIEYYDDSVIRGFDLPQQITHLRFFGWIVGKENAQGLPTRPTTTQALQYTQYLKDNDLKGYYTIMVGSLFPIQDEIDYLQKIIDQGVDVTHIQIGPELWLGKYPTGDTSKPKVYEKITLDDYIEMLDEIIPLLAENFPDIKLVVLGASHQYSTQELTELIQKYNEDGRDLYKVFESVSQKDGRYKASDYRVLFTDTTCRYILDSDYDLGISVHYYAGAKPDLQPANGEEAIFEGINWQPFISHIRHYLPEVEISVPEGGWYSVQQRQGKSEADLNKMIEFIESMVEALEDNDLPGLHILYQNQVNYHNWIYSGGLTEVGVKHLNYLKEMNEPAPDPEEPYLIGFGPEYDPDNLPIMFRQLYVLSDRTTGKTPWQFKWRNPKVIQKHHIGMNEKEIKTLF